MNKLRKTMYISIIIAMVIVIIMNSFEIVVIVDIQNDLQVNKSLKAFCDFINKKSSATTMSVNHLFYRTNQH
jgi:hypothetical protein